MISMAACFCSSMAQESRLETRWSMRSSELSVAQETRRRRLSVEVVGNSPDRSLLQSLKAEEEESVLTQQMLPYKAPPEVAEIGRQIFRFHGIRIKSQFYTVPWLLIELKFGRRNSDNELGGYRSWGPEIEERELLMTRSSPSPPLRLVVVAIWK
ncbi:unnamed protein product [Linum trigynum]|uniref:Uncharacterized protein n=1 Tax=Linum trigynum TaxID=586398 RepID=A0AAV2F268_9ROSI